MSVAAATDLPNPPPLTDAQKKLISATVPVLQQHGSEITRRFYSKMIDENPELKNYFNHSKQQRGDQSEALARAVFAYAAHINDLTPILPVVDRICNKHASLNISPEMYAIVGKYLLGAIADVVGADVFSGDLYEAWVNGYWQLARIFINKEEGIYQAVPWKGWKEFIVQKRVPEAEDVVSFYFAPKDGKPLPKYMPGQYISVQKFIVELGFNQSRQYSLSDSPHADHFRISVRRERGIRATDPVTGEVDAAQSSHPGWLSNLLHDKLQVGDSIEVSAPLGDFFLDSSDSPVVFLAAGVGVTALNSMLQTVLDAPESHRPVGWVQVVRSRAAHALHDEIFKTLDAHPSRVRKSIFYSEPESDAVQGKDYDFTGRMTVDKVPEETLYSSDPKTQYYVCGPEGFMRDIGRALSAKGVEHERIHAEVFGAGAVPI